VVMTGARCCAVLARFLLDGRFFGAGSEFPSQLIKSRFQLS
jgi:hypothetical protein